MRSRPVSSLTMIFLLISSISCSPSNGDPADADVEREDVEPADADQSDSDADAEPTCPANGDFTITRDESQPGIGLSLTFLANPASTTVEVDLAGEVVEDQLTWDFEAEESGDRRITDEILDPSAYWFASELTGATYASLVPGFDGAVGVYRVTDTAVSLLGVASLADDSTLITYDPPVDVVRFPLTPTSRWTIETRAEGRVQHVAFNADETYEIAVDGTGDVVVPAGRFPVLRVRTVLDRSAGPLSDHRISYAWVAECWGRVAYAGSAANETNLLFTTAEQYWRLTLRE